MGALDKKIYILHGWAYSLEKWEKFADLLRQSGFEPIFLKIPGLTLKSDKVWDLEKYSKWLDEKVGNSKVILLGHSNGGRIAAYFAYKYPTKVEKLILIDSAGIYHKELLLEVKRFLFGTFAKVGKKFTSSETLKKFLYNLAGEKDYQAATSNMKQSMLNLIKVDLVPYLKKINIPVLIIWGENDRITPLSDAKVMRNLIKNSKLEIIKEAKHSPFYTHPKEVADIIKNDF